MIHATGSKKFNIKIINDKIILNGERAGIRESGVLENVDDRAVYEVIQVKNGAPLFLQAHIDRMRQSTAVCGRPLRRSDAAIQDDIRRLMEWAPRPRINVKLMLRRIQGRDLFFVFQIVSRYPEPGLYETGVPVILFSGERDAPQVKSVKNALRNRVAAELEKTGAWEALLVNREGFITEGSRSNVFFSDGKGLVTPPSGTVLIGVTRKYVMAACRRTGIDVRERPVHSSELSSGFSGMFLTGTSIDVLPVARVDEKETGSARDEIIRRAAEAYREEVTRYIGDFAYREKTAAG
ncbi:MAG: hypothetical protein CSB33_03170 [Desulfobacterales bacterium]|nr:MAG: hypothetical protein CSB33_03170 [Desulfobacterales bacterium]